MGYQTVVFILNDHMHEIRKAPKTLTHAITYPPMSNTKREMDRWWDEIYTIAAENKEDVRGLRSGLVILPTFHADDVHYLRAGRNVIERIDPETKEPVK